MQHVTGLHPTMKLVLVCLADHAGKDGTNAFPSVPTIAELCGVDARTVRRTISALEGRGLIRRGNQAAASGIPPQYRPMVWDLVIFPADVSPVTGPEVSSVTGPDLTSGVTAGVTSDLTPVSPKQSKQGNQKKTGRGRTALAARSDWENPPADSWAYGQEAPIERNSS
ncbi:helix-turn-helix domain-containing protein [Arthrobacter sp. Leaf69]|uniref:helix-turn-helix domain-containing protein n=1 Tax=Arthrobacter sp. Leaf69 TaxID=1736232 RepID=UPI003FA45E66